MSSSAGASKSSTSLYVSRLRRAFLLQVHPDRFRSQTENVRKQQASLVQALSDRMAEYDFLTYASSLSSNKSSTLHNRFHSINTATTFSSNSYHSHIFYIAKNDGSISQLSIQLQNRNPYQILCAMAQSINFPLPPSPPPSSPHESEEEDTSLSIDESIMQILTQRIINHQAV